MPSLDKQSGGDLTTSTVKWRFPSTHPEGRKFAAGAAALTLFAFLFGWEWIGWLEFDILLGDVHSRNQMLARCSTQRIGSSPNGA